MKPDYRQKIKTLEELGRAIGPRPRQKTVIMCHGMFDIVHPGHLRHLAYAKDRADILIASLTADEHGTKGVLRPYVPQELRAANLAALELVDYVIIDPHPTPIAHIQYLQPDYFAKGYEYFAEGVPPRTQEEIDALESYGGEMVFTPGDVVYSSSALIEAAPPKLGLEKLLALMRDVYDLRAGHRILDVGCAKGFLLHDLLQVVPGVRVCGVDISTYAVSHAVDDVRPYLVTASADALPFGDSAFDLVVSINTAHNLDRPRCVQAIREMERVSRRFKYVQVDSWLTESQRIAFERWQLTALTYSDPGGWRRLFAEAGYSGDYYWTLTE